MANTSDKPVVLADAQDNPGAGGTSDTTGLLAALVANGARRSYIENLCRSRPTSGTSCRDLTFRFFVFYDSTRQSGPVGQTKPPNIRATHESLNQSDRLPIGRCSIVASRTTDARAGSAQHRLHLGRR